MPSDWSAAPPRAERGAAPPLWALPTAAGLVFLAVALASVPYWRAVRAEESAFATACRARLARSASSAPGAAPLRIVGVGTSLLQDATYDDEQMEVFALRRLSRDIRYARLVRTAGWFPDWCGLMEEVLAVHPDLVWVDDYVLFYRVRPWVVHPQRVRAETKLEVKRLLGPAFRIGAVDPDPGPAAVREVLEQAQARRDLNYRFGLRPEARETLRRFRDAGVPVWLLPMPLHPAARATLDEDQARVMDQTLRDLEREGLARVVRCPLRFDRTEYLDLLHLNVAGRKRYSGWLLDEAAGGPTP